MKGQRRKRISGTHKKLDSNEGSKSNEERKKESDLIKKGSESNIRNGGGYGRLSYGG
jgi:hypothetical protein